jgi:hypothetical protein
LVAAAAAFLGTSPALAANTLEGTCTLSGELAFDPPLGNDLRPTNLRDEASGACTGTLNGVPQQDAPVVIRAKGSGTLSCLDGHTTTTGTLTFTRGTRSELDDAKIRFWTDTTGGVTQFASRFGGAVSGQGIAYVNFLPYAGESALTACQAGTFDSARYDLLARTMMPVVG